VMDTTRCKGMICVRFRTLKNSDEWLSVVLNGLETSIFLHRRLLHSCSSVQVSRARFNRAVSHSETIVVSIAQSSEIVLTLVVYAIVARAGFFLVDVSGGLVLCLAFGLLCGPRGLSFVHFAAERGGGLQVGGVLGWCEHWDFLEVNDLYTPIEAFFTWVCSLVNSFVPFWCRLQEFDLGVGSYNSLRIAGSWRVEISICCLLSLIVRARLITCCVFLGIWPSLKGCQSSVLLIIVAHDCRVVIVGSHLTFVVH